MNTKLEFYLRNTQGTTLSMTCAGKDWYVNVTKSYQVVATATGRSPRAAINKLVERMGL